MTRWSFHLRRAAPLSLGMQLLQLLLVAASAVCDPVSTGVATAGPDVAVVVAAHHHGASESQTPVDQPSHGPSHDPVHMPAACPMAMVCAVSAVVATWPSIDEQTVTVMPRVMSHNDRTPFTVRRAPEPPPPRV